MSSFDKDSLSNTFIVAIGICLVCSIVVSGIAVALKPTQQANKLLDQKQNILRAAGLLSQDSNVDAQGRNVDELFAEFDVRVVDLDTGEYRSDLDPTIFDPIR
ncbi:MAG: Na(+)-translocating NADH-quinone reductase subunit C, partial [Pseudomonadales bacterium]|nr:Na(+)-translocating NADH-quinone reductase subunit C [Pseudomonadales bacterium]